jgi:hypothetical protein
MSTAAIVRRCSDWKALILGGGCDGRHKSVWARHQLKAPTCDGRHWRCQRLGNISRLGQINPSKGNLLSMEGNMIDALFNVAVFAALGLCIFGFGAWAHKRVDDGCR